MIRQYRLVLMAAAIVGLPVILMGCVNAKAACSSLGICDKESVLPVAVDLVCDSSKGSTCTKESLAETLDAVLPVVARSSGSVLRLWVMSGTVDGAATLGTVTSSETSAAQRAKVKE